MYKSFRFLLLFSLCMTLVFGGINIPGYAASTTGTLTVQVQTVSYGGGYAPKNVGAIWIVDSNGKFVKSLKVWAKSQISRLTNWNSSSAKNTTDAVTSATISSHQLHTASWDCTDVNKTVVADGTYKVCVEFTETNSTGKYTTFEFVKGPTSQTVTPSNQTSFTNIKLSYVASGGTVIPTQTPVVVPTKTPIVVPTKTPIVVASPTPTTTPSTSSPLNGAWLSKASLLNARAAFSAVHSDGKIYAVGGYQETTGATLSSAEVYNISTDSWSLVPQSMTVARQKLATAVLNGKIYAIGGVGKDGKTLNSMESYDIAAGSWSVKAAMATARDNFQTIAYDNKIYAIGGYNEESGQFLNTIEVYNPTTNSWSTLPNKMVTPRSGFGLSVLNNKLFVMGGFAYGESGDQPLNSVEIFDPASGTWSQGASMPTARGDLSAVTFGNTIFAVGGSGNKSGAINALTTVEIFNGSWATAPNLSVARDNFAIAATANEVYVLGGLDTDRTETKFIEVFVQGGSNQIVYGDVNGDKIVNSTDYAYVKRYMLGLATSFPSTNGFVAADVSGDGIVNSTDLALIKRYLLGSITKFPVESNVPTQTPVVIPTNTVTPVRPTPTNTVTPIVPTPTVTNTVGKGSLTVEVKTVSYGGKYAPRNVGAIWIVDSNGKFVKSLKVWAKSQISRLTNWNSSSGRNTTDAVTSATISSHQLHTATWNCTDVNGNVVPDGKYKVCVEFTETNSTGKYTTFEFQKGATAQTITPANQSNFTNIKLTYSASVGSSTGTVTPVKTVAPAATPSTGSDDDEEDDDEEDDD